MPKEIEFLFRLRGVNSFNTLVKKTTPSIVSSGFMHDFFISEHRFEISNQVSTNAGREVYN